MNPPSLSHLSPIHIFLISLAPRVVLFPEQTSSFVGFPGLPLYEIISQVLRDEGLFPLCCSVIYRLLEGDFQLESSATGSFEFVDSVTESDGFDIISGFVSSPLSELGTDLQELVVMFDLEHSRKKLGVVRLLGVVPKDSYIDLDFISIEGWVLIESAGGKHHSLIMPILISLDVLFVNDVDTEDLGANPNLLTNEPLGLVKDKIVLETQLGLDDELGIDGSPVLPTEFLDMPKPLSTTHFVSQKEAEANLNMLTKNLFDLVGNEVNTIMLAHELFVVAKDGINVKDMVENHLGLDVKTGMDGSPIMRTEVPEFVEETMLFSLGWENILVGFVGDLPGKSTYMLRIHRYVGDSVSLLMNLKILMIYSESFGIGAVNPILMAVCDIFGNAILMHFKSRAGVVRQVIGSSKAKQESLWSRNGMDTGFRIRNTKDSRTITANGIRCDADGIVGISRTNGSVKSGHMVMREMSCRAFGSSESSNWGFSEDADSGVGLSDTPLEEQLMHALYKMWTADIHMAGCKIHPKCRCVEATLSVLKDFSRAALEAEIGDVDMVSQVDFELVRGHLCHKHSLWAISEPKLFLCEGPWLAQEDIRLRCCINLLCSGCACRGGFLLGNQTAQLGCLRFDETGKESSGCWSYANWFAGGLSPNVCSFVGYYCAHAGWMGIEGRSFCLESLGVSQVVALIL